MKKKSLINKCLAYTVAFNFCVLNFSNIAVAQDFNAAKTIGVNIKDDTPERAVGTKPLLKSLEEGIWSEAQKTEIKAKTSGERTSHKELETYVSTVMSNILKDRISDVRVYVMDRPFFNATMAPNGYTEVWTGSLLRVQTEDELAFILGHEAGHFIHSHSVTAYEKFKSRQNAALAFNILLTAATVAVAANASSINSAQNIMNAGSSIVDIVYLGTIAAYFSYSKETESIADIYGYHYALQAGYNPQAGKNVWRKLLEDTAASDYEKVRSSPTRINIFGSHPLETDRIENLKKYNSIVGKNKIDETKEAAINARLKYRQIIRPYLGEWLKDDLRRHDYGQTISIINRLSLDGWDLGVLNFYKGEAFKQRGNAFDNDAALKAYLDAVKSDDAPKETYRQIGEIYRKLNKNTEAVEAYKNYLKNSPNAEDAWIIEDLIEQLSKTTHLKNSSEVS